MAKQKQFIIRMDEELYEKVKYKCKVHFGIGITPLIKIFLTSFITQKGVGFYVGDNDLCQLFNQWLSKKYMEIGRKGLTPLPGPRLKDLYELNPVPRSRTWRNGGDSNPRPPQ